jgi:GT2 family glycosyltransferase
MTAVGAAARVALEGATHAADAAASLLWEAPHNPAGGALISCNFAIPRRLFLEAGAFDERFPMASFEDTEFAARLGKLGVGLRFLPLAAVDHPLRPLPPASRRARRWEARVISSYDFGASTAQIAWRLPRHIALVTLSRFRGKRLRGENLRAAGSYFLEALLAIAQVPGWLYKYHHAPRSPFWAAQVAAGTAPPNFGL